MHPPKNGINTWRLDAWPLPSYPHPHLLVVLHIDLCLLPLASRDLALEHNVNLTIGSSLHLRQVEVCRDQADETSGTPDVAALTTKVSTLHYVSNCHRKIRREKSLTVGLSM